MTALLFRKHFGSLVPDDATCPEAVEWLQSLKHGEAVTIARPKKMRNSKAHRLWWGLVTLVYQNQERYETLETMVVALKVGLGHCDTVILKTGETAFIPKSISFAKMDNAEFSAFLDKTIKLVIKHFLPGVTDQELRKQVEEIIGC